MYALLRNLDDWIKGKSKSECVAWVAPRNLYFIKGGVENTQNDEELAFHLGCARIPVCIYPRESKIGQAVDTFWVNK